MNYFKNICPKQRNNIIFAAALSPDGDPDNFRELDAKYASFAFPSSSSTGY